MTRIDSVTCPRCGANIPLAEAILDPLRQQLAAELRPQLEKQAEAELSEELIDLHNSLDEKAAENRELKKNELQLRKERASLEAERQDFELEKQRAVDEARGEIWKDATAKASEQYGLQISEKDQTIKRLQVDIEDLRQRSTQVPSELRGTVQEMALDERLSARFPLDEVRRVGKGRAGGDVVQRVKDCAGTTVGTILWESKRAKQFGRDWIPTLRENARQARAEVAVLVSSVLPDEDAEPITQRDGVWLVSLALSDSLADMLRSLLLAVAQAKAAAERRDGLAGGIYDYLTGPQFQARVEGIAECMGKEWRALQQERAAVERRWSEREEALRGQLRHLAGMVGDLQGAGAELAGVPTLELSSST